MERLRLRIADGLRDDVGSNLSSIAMVLRSVTRAPELASATKVLLAESGAPINANIARKVLDLFAQLAAPKGDYQLTDTEKACFKSLVQGNLKKQ